MLIPLLALVLILWVLFQWLSHWLKSRTQRAAAWSRAWEEAAQAEAAGEYQRAAELLREALGQARQTPHFLHAGAAGVLRPELARVQFLAGDLEGAAATRYDLLTEAKAGR